MALSDTAARSAKPKSNPYKLADEKGLYLLVKPAGKYWRFDYRFGGKRKTLAFGVYPDVSLKAARDARDDGRKQIAAGIDPADNRKATKAAKRGDDPNSFEVITREWVEKYRKTWTPNHITKVVRFFEQDVFPWIGKRSVNVIAAPEILSMLRRIESRGANEIAHRIKQNCGRVFHYAIATGRAERNPVADLQGSLELLKVKHHAAITEPKAVGALLRAIEGYQGNFITQCALRIAPLVFVRPGELRKAEWTELDLNAAEWRIPAERMKMRSQHIVPLSAQAASMLRELRMLTGNRRYLFPSARTTTRPMSENTLNAALRRIGYTKDEMTSHGFRSMASTLLNEQGWHRDAIERQLAHAERDGVRAAYNYAEHLPERRKMMQAWADYLDKLKQRADVIPLHGNTA